MFCIILLFLVLVVAYGATLITGAKREQKLMVKEQMRRFSSIRWSSNPSHGLTGIEMRQQRSQSVTEIADPMGGDTVEEEKSPNGLTS